MELQALNSEIPLLKTVNHLAVRVDGFGDVAGKGTKNESDDIKPVVVSENADSHFFWLRELAGEE
eukprot:5099765-Prorocentrum_lima.AAC.1